MIVVCRGLEYYVLLQSELTEFTQINAIERIIEQRLNYKTLIIDHKKEFVIVIAGQPETDERLLESKYYKKNKKDWFQNSQSRTIQLEDQEDMILTEPETILLNYILNHLEVKHHGWFDAVYHRG